MSGVIVIGGGAAGFFGAISCAEHGVGEILILERGAEVLTKVKISGGGRCNVTHACFDPRDLVEHYPRGRKSLLGPFHHWQVRDTIEWFEQRGVSLKTEADGRIFPETDDSQSIIDALTEAARALGVKWRTRCGASRVTLRPEGGFAVQTGDGEVLEARCLLIATGGIRSGAARRPVDDLGHEVEPPVPSLFTFRIEDARLEGLAGVTVPEVTVRAGRHEVTGPVLVTHWGLSGPAILKLSALAARELAERHYEVDLQVDWSAGVRAEELAERFEGERRRHGARRVRTRSLLEGMPRRMWERICEAAGLEEETTWSTLTREQARALSIQLREARFPVRGKSLNKDEFVTCGGVRLRDVNTRTMESRHLPGLYFAGEVLDIDGITGGFNFQAAWTTGRLAGEAIAASLA